MFEDNKDEIFKSIAISFFRVWRWWYGCTDEEKEQYTDRLDEYVRFSREQFPVFGLKTWPISLRLSTFFIRRKSRMGFAILYYFNQLFKIGVPEPDAVIYLDMPVEISQKMMSVRYNGDENKKDIHENMSMAPAKYCCGYSS